MLKKIADIALILLLIVATTGITIGRHYCGNHLVAVSLFKWDHCGCGDKDCHTVIRQIKISDTYSEPELIHSTTLTSLELPSIIVVDFGSFTHPELSATFFFIKAPPLSAKNPFAFLQSFRC
jgi:hypothetical protein